MGFFRRQKDKFLIPKILDWLSAGRPVRSTDVHKRARQLELVGRSTGRSTVQRVLLSGNGLGRPGGRPSESSALCFLFPVDRWLNGHKYNRWPPGRPEGQFCPCLLPTGRFSLGLYIPHFLSCFR